MAVRKSYGSESEKIEAYKENLDMNLLGEIYHPHMDMVLAVCYKYFKDKGLAQDAVIDIFEILRSKIHKHDIKAFKPWLYTLSRNHCLMQLRKKKREVGFEEFHRPKNVEFEQILHLNGEDEHEQHLNLLEQCLKQLKTEQQKSVALFYLEGKSYEEIVGLTNFELKKVKSYIQNGKRNLKICMDKNSTSNEG